MARSQCSHLVSGHRVVAASRGDRTCDVHRSEGCDGFEGGIVWVWPRFLMRLSGACQVFFTVRIEAL